MYIKIFFLSASMIFIIKKKMVNKLAIYLNNFELQLEKVLFRGY
jgi:hypothetical protein